MIECMQISEETAVVLSVIGVAIAVGFVAAVAAWFAGRSALTSELTDALDYIELERERIARHGRRCRREY